MTTAGLSLEGEGDAGSNLVTSFAIPIGRESEAARDLLACVMGGAEVNLANDLDEGGEGVTSFRLTSSGLASRVGGHGWQGRWQPLDEAGVLAAIIALAPQNRGGHWTSQGSIVRPKGPA